MTVPVEQVTSPAALLPFSELGFPQHGRYLLTLDQVKSAFVDAEIFQESATRRDCWQGLLAYLQMWKIFESKLARVIHDEGLILCLWLGGSFISTVRLNPNNVDLTVFVDGTVFSRAAQAGIGFKTQLKKLASRSHLERELRVTPTIVQYRYPGTPWQREPYELDQHDYLVKRGGLDDWWTRARPEGEPKGPPTPETSRWVRGYVEVRLA